MGKLICMRGVPGSGKSVLAAEIRQSKIQEGYTAVICSADNFFLVPENPKNPDSLVKYIFDPSKISAAHKWCQRKAETAMRDKIDYVIIDNTNTCGWELYPYVDMAIFHGYDIEFLEPRTPWWIAVKPLLNSTRQEKNIQPYCKVFAERNTHGVPENAILKMLMRWESDLTLESVIAGS